MIGDTGSIIGGDLDIEHHGNIVCRKTRFRHLRELFFRLRLKHQKDLVLFKKKTHILTNAVEIKKKGPTIRHLDIPTFLTTIPVIVCVRIVTSYNKYPEMESYRTSDWPMWYKKNLGK